MARAGFSRAIDTLRLFTDTLEFSESDDDGWRVLGELCDSCIAGRGDVEAKVSILIWLLNLTGSDIEGNYVEVCYATLMHLLASNSKAADAVRLLLQLAPKGAIDAKEHPRGFTALQGCVALADNGLSEILSMEPNLHALSRDLLYSPEEETPTSLAMYSSWAFWLFRDGLIVTNVDIDELVYRELDHDGPLANAGWDVPSLRALFNCHVDPDIYLHEPWEWTCGDCGTKKEPIRVQPFWYRFLEKVRRRRANFIPYQNQTLPSSELDLGHKNFLSEQADSSNATTETEHIAQIHSSTVPSPNLTHHQSPSEPTVEEPLDLSYPTHTGITDYVYEKDEIICISCWCKFRDSGQRPTPCFSGSSSSVADNSSEDDFSPFLFNT